MVGDETAVANTDREIYTTHDERGNFYGDKIFVTVAGGIGFSVGGHCIVKPLREWFLLAGPIDEMAVLKTCIERAEDIIWDIDNNPQSFDKNNGAHLGVQAVAEAIRDSLKGALSRITEKA